jgi:hypothetical protein
MADAGYDAAYRKLLEMGYTPAGARAALAGDGPSGAARLDQKPPGATIGPTVPVLVSTDDARGLVVLQFEHGWLAVPPASAHNLAARLTRAADSIDARG